VVASLDDRRSEPRGRGGGRCVPGDDEAAPRQHIRDDHRRLAEVEEGDGARAVLADGGAAAEIRTAALRLLGGLAEHRQRGADLLYEAYQVDIGPGD
jgi:hypothetical protein